MQERQRVLEARGTIFVLQGKYRLRYCIYVKILLISNSYPDYVGSYRGIFIRKLCLALKSQGLDMIVLTPRVFWQSPFYEVDSGIRVYRFWYPSGNQPLGQYGRIPVFVMSCFMVSGFLMALALILKEKPDVVHGNWIVPTGLIASLAGRLTRVPVVNTARGMDVRISDRGLAGILFNLAAQLSDRLVVVSEAMRGHRVLKNAEIIPSGVDDVFFTLEAHHGQPKIIYTRSLEPVYDVPTLIRSIPLVVQQYPAARFIIAGTGSQEAFLKNLVHALHMDGQVEFVGAVTQQGIVQLMQNALVFVSPSLDDGTSIALLEAMGAGLVPIVSDIGANRPWVRDGKDGYLFEPGDAYDLAQAIIKALEGRIQPSILAEKRDYVKQRVAWSTIAQQYLSLYKQVVDRKGRR